MKRHKKVLIVVGIVLAVAILVPVIHHYQLRAATEAYVAQLKAQGEPMELAQVIPPPVPPEQNSADTFRKAAALFEADQGFLGTNYGIGCMEMVAPGKAMICSRQPDVHNYNATNSWEEVTTAVAQNKESFALLRQIIVRPDFDFHINYERGVADLAFTNLYLAESRRATLRLETATLCDLHLGDTISAVEDLRAMLALVKAMRDERLVISELVRIAIVNIALTVNWEVLQSTNVTDEQLAELQQDWTSLDFIRNGENTLAMERVLGEITLAKWRSSSLELQHYYFDLGKRAREAMGLPDKNGTFWEKTRMTTKTFMWHYWWSYPDELRALRGYEVLLDTVRFAETNHSFQTALHDQESRLAALGIDKLDDEFSTSFDPEKIDMHSMLSQSIVALSGTVRRVMTAETAKEVVITAIALKRYQLKHGNYPPDLNSLVPEFVPKVPRDPVDGQPLCYRRNADGTFLLYSVGENGKDDGGNPSLEKGAEPSYPSWQSIHALDWVWPQPATPQEIQAFYTRPKSGN
jgi:hypothetical protein